MMELRSFLAIPKGKVTRWDSALEDRAKLGCQSRGVVDVKG